VRSICIGKNRKGWPAYGDYKRKSDTPFDYIKEVVQKGKGKKIENNSSASPSRSERGIQGVGKDE